MYTNGGFYEAVSIYGTTGEEGLSLNVRALSPVLILVLVLLNQVPALAQTTTEPSVTKKTIALNEPAVILLSEAYAATFSVPSSTYQIDSQNAFHFTAGTDMVTLPVQESFFGSGFIITPDGYIITNAHVATDQDAKVSFLSDLAATELQSELQQSKFSDQLSQNFENAFYEYLQSNGAFTAEQNTLVAYLPVIGSNGSLIGQALSAEVKVAGDMVGTGSEQDVAVIKVSANHPLPTVQLGDSDSVSPGDSVVIIGYPGISAVSAQNIGGIESLVPSASAGIVSALKPMAEGWTVIQTDATVNHGNSGGPGFDAGGSVVGIATFGGLSVSGNNELAGIHFLVPINIAKQFLSKISVQNTRGQLDQDWQQGLEYFWANHYSAAVQEFNAVLSLYPGDPYASQDLQQANTEITKGNDIPLSTTTPLSSTSSSSNANGASASGGSEIPWGPLIVGIAIIAALTWLITKRRHRKMPAVRRPISVPLPVSAKFCRTCGTAIGRPTRFCPKCGNSLTRPAYRR